jgi:signal transduction histidine kinase
MDVFHWFGNAATGGYAPGAGRAALWAWVTIGLIGAIAAGYCAIAVHWYFQAKLAGRDAGKAALARLRTICVCCAACGWAFHAANTPWLVWRAYDLVLLALAVYTWSFVARTRGLGLVDDRLAQVEELERSADRYREIAELLPHMVWTATADGRIDFANRRWREYAADNRTWLEAVHPDEHPDAAARWAAAVAAREPFMLEVRLGGAGGYRTFVVRATPIVHGPAGVQWLGACADIEDQKRVAAEKEMQARQKSFVLNALSHDLRAPLHNVLMNAHLLKLSARDEADVESVDMIVENVVAAGDLVSKLLDFAKVGAQDHNDLESVPVAALVQQVARRFQPLTEQKGLDLRVAVRDDHRDAAFLTDRRKFDRILSNLVDNAVKYTPRGGTVSLELAAAAAADGPNLVVRVSDTGIGIRRENVPYLFDEFYQVNNYERDRSKGFGMGLAICRSLARHIGGEVRLASTGPGGSCFELVVPRVGPDRGGRPGSADGNGADAPAAGICRN